MSKTKQESTKVHVAEKPAKTATKPEPTEAQQLANLLLSGDTETVRNALVKQFGIGVNVVMTDALINMVKELTDGR